MWLALVLLAFLSALLAAVRSERVSGRRLATAPWTNIQGTPRAWWIAHGIALLALTPLLVRLPFFLRGSHVLLLGDAPSHAAIAQSLARDGVPHGWLETHDGGFPLGVNYPPLGWCLAAILMRCGLPTATTIQALGLLPYVVMPQLVVRGSRIAGARPCSAIVGATLFAWISPYNYWLGTHHSYLGLGLVSQSIGILLVAIALLSLLSKTTTWQSAMAGGLLAAAHPQLTAMTCVALLALTPFARRPLRVRLAMLMTGAVLFGAALYGPGLAALSAPFGWIPTGANWWIVGYTPDRLWRWFVEYELFDFESVPAITSVAVLSFLVLVVRVRKRGPAAVVAVTCWTFALTISGNLLRDAGALAASLLSFLQPQRAFALVPFVLAATLVAGWEELITIATDLNLPSRLARYQPTLALVCTSLIVSAVAVIAITRDVRWLAHRVEIEREAMLDEGQCAGMTGAREFVATLGKGRTGRLDSFESPYYNNECSKSVGVELASQVPLGVSRGAGAHVGVLTAAFSSLNPESREAKERGWTPRAESLGVRWIVYGVEDRPTSNGWRVIHAARNVEVAERVGGTDVVGVGCIERAWRGHVADVRDALFTDIASPTGVPGPATTIEDPSRLTALDQSGGPFRVEPVASGDCEASHATVAEKRREPGAYEADVESPSPVDVVIRATAFPTWVIRIDGVPAPVTVVAPGFPSARMPAGKHHVEAVVSPPRFYWAGVFLGAMVVAGLAFETHRRSKKIA